MKPVRPFECITHSWGVFLCVLFFFLVPVVRMGIPVLHIIWYWLIHIFEE
jgi:hypothetical protein